MKDASEQMVGAGAEVVCAWCGSLIRHGASKPAQRMCQHCFVRMMREHVRAHRQDAGRRYASDR
jgi:hypothetical protein